MSLAQALSRRTGFVPFIIAGDPNLSATARYLKALEKAGADIIEIGVPFSDPVADGPVIQASSQRALRAGTTLESTLSLIKRLRGSGFRVPVILFTYLNPCLKFGHVRFAELCAQSGVDGVLVVDLPLENADCVADELARRGLELVLLAAPTTSDARLRRIGRRSGSIVYYVSREGVTGARHGLAPGLPARLKRVRRLVGKPLIVGFGVAGPAQARALARHAEGVVVGSALVAIAAKGGEAALTRLARRLVRGLSRNGD